ncbi:hypothetical protein A0H81_12055 [Grifola frondosa]|uniref:Uncharacterized protein n=1 Tax=Grifola frondosa TaxID=5627 RepID=A0A1C7LTE9_GRIFR|nr:hypothetical protein A0H81_12055 [Grifola frondosa]
MSGLLLCASGNDDSEGDVYPGGGDGNDDGSQSEDDGHDAGERNGAHMFNTGVEFERVMPGAAASPGEHGQHHLDPGQSHPPYPLFSAVVLLERYSYMCP